MAQQLISSIPVFALLVGFIPSIAWLLFWLNIDRQHKKPFGLLLACFLIGAASVFFATLFEQGARYISSDQNTQIILGAVIEEVLKFLAFYFVAYNSPFNNEAVDPAIYIIIVALGFAAAENILYVLQPSISISTTAILLTGSLRFFGSTLLHTISSCFVGIMIGISSKNMRTVAIMFGLAGAIFLHATFNFFILKNDTASLLQIYGYLWIAAIISHIILEKLRRIPMSGTLKQL